ncbi:NADPH:quinone oxidoreductase family protein [Haliea sp. E17]|uniref:NADPH:quinone oxidoreductase family protein n=1 Tax=Haliea sp. E17 TaxID=3401576 RepID=UPI003AAA3519
MPRAVISDTLGPLENYSVRDYDPGPPGPGQVRIAVRAAGVSFVDVLNATGRYQGRAPVPFIPGSEFAGVVEALGEGVTQFSPGQAVMSGGWGGAFAEAALVDADTVHAMPAGMDFVQAAVFRVSALTAWHALVDRAQLQPGETLLVLGAGGATGYAAVQIGAWLGARVIASASTAGKRGLALHGGAETAVDARSTNWREAVQAANQGRPLDVVFDPVGGEATERAFRCLGFAGRHLVVGFPGGISALPTNLPLLKGASLVGVNLQAQSIAAPRSASANLERLVDLAGKGLFWPVVADTWPLEQFAAAMAAVERGTSEGRIVITMDSVAGA